MSRSTKSRRSAMSAAADYRFQLARNVLLKFYHEQQLATAVMPSVGKPIPHDSADRSCDRHGAVHRRPAAAQRRTVRRLCRQPGCGGRIEAIDVSMRPSAAGSRRDSTRPTICRARICSARSFRDEPVLADGEVLYVGQPVVVLRPNRAACWNKRGGW